MTRKSASVVLALVASTAFGQVPAAKIGLPSPALPPQPVGVDAFVQLAVQKNPRLVRAALRHRCGEGPPVRGRPLPEPGARRPRGRTRRPDGQGRDLQRARVAQEIVLGKKLRLSQAVVAHEIDQASLALLAEQLCPHRLRARDFHMKCSRCARRRDNPGRCREARRGSDRTGAKEFRGQADLPARRHSARSGTRTLSARRGRGGRAANFQPPTAGSRPWSATHGWQLCRSRERLEVELPEYDQDRTREIVLATHPEVRSAKVGIERAQATYRRAEAEPTPNVTITGGYVRQYETRSQDGRIGVSVPLPTFNRNQGNVSAALAEVGMAMQDVGRAEEQPCRASRDGLSHLQLDEAACWSATRPRSCRERKRLIACRWRVSRAGSSNILRGPASSACRGRSAARAEQVTRRSVAGRQRNLRVSAGRELADHDRRPDETEIVTTCTRERSSIDAMERMAIMLVSSNEMYPPR